MSQRHSTGLSGLDAQLGGGIPPGSAVLLLSEPMNAQELLAYQFAAGSREKPACTYLTTDRSVEDVKTSMGAIELDVERIEFQSLTKTAKPRFQADHRLVLDNFSSLCRNIGWDAAFKVLEAFRASLKEGGQIGLIVVVDGLHSPEEMTWLRLWADGVMSMGFDRQGFGLYPYLKVTKMRGVPDSARFLLFKETERGLFMESTRRVF